MSDEKRLRLVTETDRPPKRLPWADHYRVGNPYSRFAVIRYPTTGPASLTRRWSKPKGGIVLGRWGFWWSR